MPIIGPVNVQDVGYKFINAPEQLPGYGTGTITLEADTIYDLKLGGISISDSIKWPEDGNCKLQNGVITYTGSGTLFNTAEMGNNVKRISDVTIIFTGGGTLFSLTGTNPLGAFVIDNMLIVGAASLGTMSGFVFTETAIRMLQFGTGLTFNNMALVEISRVQMLGTNQSTTFINFTGTTSGPIVISDLAPTINTNEYLFDFNTGITYSGVAVNNVTTVFAGSADYTQVFATGSNTQKSLGFNFAINEYIPDSTVSSEVGFQDNSAETVVDQVLVPVKVNGTYTNGFEERTTYSSDGYITHTGLEPVSVSVRAYISLEPVTGITILMGGYIGVVRTDTCGITFTNGTNTVNEVGHTLSNGDSIIFGTDGTLPAEIRDDHFYWVVNAAADTFQISRTEGGAVHAFTDDGTGTHCYALGEYIESSEVTTSPSVNEPDNIVVESLVELFTGDKVFVLVDNHDSTSNIVVTSINVILNKI